MDKKRTFKIGFVLFFVCAISALTLAGLNTALSGKRKNNEKKKIDEAINNIAGEYENYIVEDIEYEKEDDAVKAFASIVKKYTISFANKKNMVVYMVEGKNSFGDASIMVGIENNVISKVEIVSFSQTSSGGIIKALPNEYVGKSVDTEILTNSYIKDNYTGGTRGSIMMNLMMTLVIEYEGGSN